MKKIYLAGPDVFTPDAVAVGAELKRLAAEYGFIGLFPLDNKIPPQQTPQQTAGVIMEANLKLLRTADIIMANLNPFRGSEPDSGTVFEVGYGVALDKEVYGYAADRRPLIERVRDAQNLPPEADRCSAGMLIEDFGLSHNLMFSHLVVAADPRSCLELIAKRTGRQ